MFETQGRYLKTRDVRESDVALRKGAKRRGGYTTSEAELEPSFFTFVVSTVATSPSTRVLGLVATVLTTSCCWFGLGCVVVDAPFLGVFGGGR